MDLVMRIQFFKIFEVIPDIFVALRCVAMRKVQQAHQ